MKYLILTLAFFVMAISPVAAQIERYEFDKAHTQIIFKVNHLGYSNSHGVFTDFDGFFEFNRPEPVKSKVEVTIKTDSIDLNDKKWNDHMKNEDFFNVEKYPTMTFKGTEIEVTGKNTAKITGNLTILETTKPVTMDVVFNKAAKSPFGEKYVAGFSATANLKRSDFGMKYGLPLVGNDVAITIEVEGVRKNGGVVNE